MVEDLSDLSPVLIWATGAIGGTLAAYWARAGHSVVAVDTVAEHVERYLAYGVNRLFPANDPFIV